MQQVTNTILMVRPIHFRMNEQTAVNNYFQEDPHLKNTIVNGRAQEEFDVFVEKLRTFGVQVIIAPDIENLDAPDAVFPNNWISLHENGDLTIYPMFAENRRIERRESIFELLESKGFVIHNIVDYIAAEKDNLFLEGTGSLALDRQNRKAYCALSPRADEALLLEFCEDFEYTPVVFIAYQTVNEQRLPIYHTNVMMCLAETFAIICLDCIDDKKERKNVLNHLKEDGKEVIAITEEQVANFAGNMLQVIGADNKRLLVMSEAAHKSLTEKQLDTIHKHCEILSSPIDTIETCGGGSARCMMAEVFLPKEDH